MFNSTSNIMVVILPYIRFVILRLQSCVEFCWNDCRIACQLCNSKVVTNDKISLKAYAEFTQISSWVSLKCYHSLMKILQNQQCQTENLHLVSLSKQEKLKETSKFLKEIDNISVFIS